MSKPIHLLLYSLKINIGIESKPLFWFAVAGQLKNIFDGISEDRDPLHAWEEVLRIVEEVHIDLVDLIELILIVLYESISQIAIDSHPWEKLLIFFYNFTSFFNDLLHEGWAVFDDKISQHYRLFSGLEVLRQFFEIGLVDQFLNISFLLFDP